MTTYDAVADLDLVIESSARSTQSLDTSSAFERTTTTISLHGAGETGRGEDVTYETEDHEAWADAPPLADELGGEWTLDSFTTELDATDLFPGHDPSRSTARHYRRWGVESAALDLALRQADQSLGAALDRSAAPVRFVVSTRLPDGDTSRVHDLLDRVPDTEFKLDATPEWTDDIVAELDATDAVRIVDMKGQYEGTAVDQPAEPVLYERVLDGFPDTIIEDPMVTDAVEAILAAERDRLSWDAPITSVESIHALPYDPDWLNIKPSRFGSVRAVFDTIDYCLANDITMYGGGQFELDIGRRQLQTLASLFYPNSPNDIAPREYHSPDLPNHPATSPLAIPTDTPGFGW